jgi:hypothetical protein
VIGVGELLVRYLRWRLANRLYYGIGDVIFAAFLPAEEFFDAV